MCLCVCVCVLYIYTFITHSVKWEKLWLKLASLSARTPGFSIKRSSIHLFTLSRCFTLRKLQFLMVEESVADSWSTLSPVRKYVWNIPVIYKIRSMWKFSLIFSNKYKKTVAFGFIFILCQQLHFHLKRNELMQNNGE